MTVQPYQAIPAGLANGAPARRAQGLCIGVHAFPKMGKSSVADTGPEPRLIVDAEQAGFWTPSRKIYWDPARQTVPVPDGSWQTCVALVKDIDTLFAINRVMYGGQHPFNSISVDSVPSVAHRAMMAMAGRRKMERDDWGQLLRDILQVVVGYKDLLTHPTNPVWSVTYVFPTHYDHRTRKWRPWLQGQSADLVPYQFDIMGWMYKAGGEHRLWSGPSDSYETGNRLWGRLPDDMVIGHPGMVPGWTVETMVEQAIAASQ